jgi:aminopeptidase YwaD
LRADSSRLLAAVLLGVLSSCSSPEPAPAPADPARPASPAPADDAPHGTKLAVTPALAAPAPTSLSTAINLMDSVFDSAEAMKLLKAIDPYFRVRGNEGYRKSTERILLLLREAGFTEGSSDADLSRDTAELRDLGPVEPAWTPLSGKLEIVAPEPLILHQFENEGGLERTFVCVNSFATRPEGLVAPLVKYDQNRPVDTYAGTVVFGMLPAEQLFARAVQQGGALGVISGWLPDYNEPEINPTIIRYAKIPYDAEKHGFALNVSPRSAKALQDRLARGPVHVKVTLGMRFADSRCRTVVATIGGTQANAGAVCVVGHLDEPGANDNASGVAAMSAMAAGYLRAIKDGRVQRPRRPIIFLFGAELECSAEWLDSAGVRTDLAIVMDMVAEDQNLTGAVALFERAPDPGAIWDRSPLDVHTEWGRKEDLRESDLKGFFINDYMLAGLRSRAAATGWNVRDNPFEGGSDHESFLARGIPAGLLWHFTDRYYHTNLDRLDKVSEQEMKQQAVVAMGVIDHFAHAGLQRAHEVLNLVMASARARLEAEASNAANFLAVPAVANDPDQMASVVRRERQIIVAWGRWYREALLSVDAFDPDPSGGPEHAQLEADIDRAVTELRELEHEILDRM